MSVVDAGKYKTVTKLSDANFIIYRKGALTAMLLDLKIRRKRLLPSVSERRWIERSVIGS